MQEKGSENIGSGPTLVEGIVSLFLGYFAAVLLNAVFAMFGLRVEDDLGFYLLVLVMSAMVFGAIRLARHWRKSSIG